MRYQIILVAILFLSLSAFGQTESIVIGEKLKVQSKILNESRYVNVYTPHSYNITDGVRYPVIYLMDGDYNFHYVTGLVEQLSMISEKVPEMIVVGISDSGHDNYVKNCTPYDEKSNPDGNSEKFLSFIEKELKTFMDENYKTSKYDVLIGHSLGGLFVINALLTEPTSFDNYVAISPSLWWNDFKPEKDVVSFFEKNEGINKALYLSIGNEEGMGVYGFYSELDVQTFSDSYYKKASLELKKEFTIYENENHNSVGLLSIKDALEGIFENYEIEKSAFNKITSFEEYTSYMKTYREKIGVGFRLPPRQFKQILKKEFEKDKSSLAKIEDEIMKNYPASKGDYYNFLGNLYLQSKDSTKGIALLKKSCEVSPSSIENIVSLGDAYLKEKKIDEAKGQFEKAIKMSKEIQVSNWYLNLLEGKLNMVE